MFGAWRQRDLVGALRSAARTGLPLDLAAGVSAANLDAAHGSTWPAHRRVPGELLRSILLEPGLTSDPRGLRLSGALVTGTLDLDHVALPCPLIVTGSHFEQPATLRGTKILQLSFADSYLPGLNFDLARIYGDVSFRGLTATGAVSASYAHISGPLDLRNAKLTNEAGDALLLDGARIDGGVSLCGLTGIGAVSASYAQISGPLDLRNATLANEAGDALSLNRARIDGSVFLNAMSVTGVVRALGAQITGQLSLEMAKLANEGGDALTLSRARIEGSVLLGGLAASGAVRALGAQIGGQLNLEEATLTNEGGDALNLERARIEGSVLLGGLAASGAVRALGAQIGGQLNLDRATLTNEGGEALTLDDARLDGNVSFGGLTATGQVRVLGAQITGQLILRDAELTNKGGNALLGSSLKVGSLSMTGAAVQGLNLTVAQIGNLVVDEHLPPNGLPGPLLASGWQVQDVHGVVRNSRHAASDWLATAPTFVAQPWHELAQVYDRNGQPSDARYLRLQAARRTTQTAPGWSKPPRIAYGLLVGYGYYPLLAGAWLVGALLTAWLITGTHSAAFAPTKPADAKAAAAAAATSQTATPNMPGTRSRPVNTPLTGATSCKQMVGYPCLRPALYALEMVLPPTVTTGQSSAWQPTPAWLAYALTALKTFGWLLTALLLAGVTGLLRKT